MGRVHVETYNHRLMSIADYTDFEMLKKLFKNYHQLQKLEWKGDSVASCIRMDLDNALSQMEEEVAETIRKIWIERWTYREYRQLRKIGDATINRRLEKGLKQAREVLEGIQ